MPCGLMTGFLKIGWPRSVREVFSLAFGSFFLPGVGEELLFRVIPLAGQGEDFSWFIIAIMLCVFTVPYHMDACHFQHEVFDDPTFLGMAFILGAACTFVFCR